MCRTSEYAGRLIQQYAEIFNKRNLPHHSIGLNLPLPSIDTSQLSTICFDAAVALRKQPTLLKLEGEFNIIGDIHGNIRDLIRVLHLCGHPENTKYLFLGDYVDRGDFSLEVITLLFALICVYPQNVYLIRGNHEFGEINKNYGFFSHLTQLGLSEDIWTAFQSTFSWLPLAAIVQGNIFCVHGGLSPLLNSLSQIEEIKRPITSCRDNLVRDLVWSDPSDTTESFAPSFRGQGYLFGNYVTKRFLEQTGMKNIVRAHQCVMKGVDTFADGVGYTVFSTSNYCNVHDNHCGVLKVFQDGRIEAYFIKQLPILRRAEAKFTGDTSILRNNMLFTLMAPSPAKKNNLRSPLLVNPATTQIGGKRKKRHSSYVWTTPKDSDSPITFI